MDDVDLYHQVTNEYEKEYLVGNCHALAIALHRLTGWPLEAVITDEENDDFNHVWVVHPTGMALDIKGLNARDFVAACHQFDGHVASVDEAWLANIMLPVRGTVLYEQQIAHATECAKTYLLPQLRLTDIPEMQGCGPRP